jgi:Polysaccharide lyase
MGRISRALRLSVILLTPLAALAQEAAQADLQDGFDGPGFAESGGLYYRRNSEQAAGTVEFQAAVRRTGAGALKLSVRPFCPPGSEGCSERAEIWERTELRVPYDQGVWYGFAVRFDDHPPHDDHRRVIAQWKREIGPEADGDFSPFLAFRLNRGRLFVTAETNFVPLPEDAPRPVAGRCPEGMAPAWLRPETDQMRILVVADPGWSKDDGQEFDRCTAAVQVTAGEAALPGVVSDWVDYVVYTKPGPDGGGHVEIFADGRRVATVRGRIGHDDHGLGANQYFKFGPYRDAGDDLWTMYYDDFRRSSRCERVLVEPAACAAVGR